MKLRILYVATVLISFAACKTPYKATDTSAPVADSSTSTADTTMSSKHVNTIKNRFNRSGWQKLIRSGCCQNRIQVK